MFILPILAVLQLLQVEAVMFKNQRGLQFDVFFPNYTDTTPHARLFRLSFPNMTEMTTCFWMYPMESYYVPFSYSTATHDDEIRVMVHSRQTLITLGQRLTIQVNAVPPLYQWTHLCFTWRSDTGLSKLYFNGKLIVKPFVLNKGYTIKGGGKLVLGQDQDNPGGVLNSEKGMVGRISEVQIWNRALPTDSIEMISECSPAYFGNVVDWQQAYIRLDDYATPKDSLLPCVQFLTVDYPCKDVDYEDNDDVLTSRKPNYRRS